MNNKNKLLSRFSLGAVAAVSVAAVVLVNLCICFIPAKFRTADTTKNGAYTLSNEAKAVLDSIDEEITVYAIEANGLDTRYEYLLDVIDGHGKLDIKWTSFEDVADKADALGVTEDNIGPYGLIVEGQKRSIYLDYYSLIRVANKNSTLLSYIQALSSSAGVSYAEISNGRGEMTLTQLQAVGNQIYRRKNKAKRRTNKRTSEKDTI